MPRSALLLVAHGSPDPGWRAPLDAICARTRELAPERRIELCFLEHDRPELGSAIADLRGDGVTQVRVVALLLSGGGRHMRHDIPAALERARASFPELELVLAPLPAGAYPEVIHAVARAVLTQ